VHALPLQQRQHCGAPAGSVVPEVGSLRAALPSAVHPFAFPSSLGVADAKQVPALDSQGKAPKARSRKRKWIMPKGSRVGGAGNTAFAECQDLLLVATLLAQSTNWFVQVVCEHG